MNDTERLWVKREIKNEIDWHVTFKHKADPFWVIDCPVCKHPTMGTYGNKDGVGCTICLTCGGPFIGGLVEIKPSQSRK